MKTRLGFIVEAKSELANRLAELGSDLDDYFSYNHILSTDELDYEKYFEGWKSSIYKAAKKHFINSSVFNLDYSKSELASLFGDFDNEIELFDRWWIIEEADCEIIPTTWCST